MTPQEIRDAVAARQDLIAMGGDSAGIAAALTNTTTRVRPMQIGYGTVLEYFGLEAGNAFLDHINTAQEFRYLKTVLQRGELEVSAQIVQEGIAALVTANVITQTHADALISLIHVPVLITAAEVQAAIYNDDGTLRI